VEETPEFDKVAEISLERRRTGILLKRFAWAIEILAVGIGLGIAVMQLYASFEELNSGADGELNFGDWANILIAATPFIMVAFVEITKIPFVDAFYKTSSRLWKSVFILSLLIISLITFESALNGFERNFNALNISVTRLQKKLLVTEESMFPIEQKIERAQALTMDRVEAQFTQGTENLTKQKLTQVESIENRKRLLQASVQTEFTAGIRSQMNAAEQRIIELQDQLNAELDRTSSAFIREEESRLRAQQDEVRQLVQDYNREQTRLDQIQEDATKQIDEASFFTRSGIRAQQDERIAEQSARVADARARLERARSGELRDIQRIAFRQDQENIRIQFDERIAAERKKLRELESTYNQAIGLRSKDLEASLASLDNEIARINERFAPQYAALDTTRAQQLAVLENNEALIAGWLSELDDLRDERVTLRDQTNTAIGDNQVYRMAQLFSGVDSAADTPPAYVVRIAAIWFGSLAAMVAFTGVVLALASNVILDPTRPDFNGARKGIIRPELAKFLRSLRRAIAYRRRLDRKPIIKERVVEITKEVPVDKVVKVEVPIEVVRRELVHVPLYTNDPNLIGSPDLGDPNSLAKSKVT
jgi:hypothetical protein